jgi:RNA polymerase sigma-70 factor (ECF subfamily)
MAGHAIPGEMVLKQANFSDVETESSVGGLVSTYMPMVFRIAYSILRNHHDAEDATQECFLKVFKLAQKTKGLSDVRNTKTWLARVAWTTALDRRSRRAAVAEHEVSFGFPDMAPSETSAEQAGVEGFKDPAATPDELAAGHEMRRTMERLIAALPEDLRQPLELSTVQELNSAEIAEVMGIPEGSVRTRLMRARRLLKEKLATLMEVKKHG